MSLSKLSLFSMLASRIFAISRRTWILISVVILTLAVLAIWLTISLAGWLFGMAQQGVVSPNRRKFRQPNSSPATIASRSMTWPSP